MTHERLFDLGFLRSERSNEGEEAFVSCGVVFKVDTLDLRLCSPLKTVGFY